MPTSANYLRWLFVVMALIIILLGSACTTQETSRFVRSENDASLLLADFVSAIEREDRETMYVMLSSTEGIPRDTVIGSQADLQSLADVLTTAELVNTTAEYTDFRVNDKRLDGTPTTWLVRIIYGEVGVDTSAGIALYQ